jgi:hypothetical protein
MLKELGIRYCFTPSQVIFLQHFLHDLNGTGNICDHNNTNETINADGSSGFTDKKAVMWAMGLIFTELVSVLLIAWSWSIICRLVCPFQINLYVHVEVHIL